ncbi:unnamed protein product [Aphanomyces euteiches]|uniref:RRM domain-containing protein n=1 Tax=Aphanomyces euteiches TaxID=100861 RepID=A0A6G0WVU0_9STRA|nr:hypothetical protein Ae201684_011222 [Aphanomyces euteiches]KAH9058768.1 hypothetical protein Ae201684P_006108 [Aphanomyces euteiches]KAH9145637.1 hypothetical protein AeRB84_010448 [Aphanomyces euteiches]
MISRILAARGVLSQSVRPRSPLAPWTATLSAVDVFGCSPAQFFSSESESTSETKIYVGGLPFNATDDEIVKEFSRFGTIVDVQRRQRGTHRGVCFISYSKPEEARNALSMHKANFGSRWLQVNLLKTKPEEPSAATTAATREEDVKNRIWIGGLPFNTTEQDIHEQFGQFGTIQAVTFLKQPNGAMMGVCFVTYSSPEEAHEALSMDKASFGNRWIQVKPAKKRQKKPVQQPSEPTSRVFVSNLRFDKTEDDLKQLFSPYGVITNVKIVRHPETQKSRGYGFVQFESLESASAALAFNGTIIDGRDLEVKPATAKEEPKVVHQNIVFVANLPLDVEEDMLHAMFEHCGGISSIRLAKNQQTGEFLGYSHIEFALPESAQAALELRGANIDGKIIHVEMAEKKVREPRKTATS